MPLLPSGVTSVAVLLTGGLVFSPPVRDFFLPSRASHVLDSFPNPARFHAD